MTTLPGTLKELPINLAVNAQAKSVDFAFFPFNSFWVERCFEFFCPMLIKCSHTIPDPLDNDGKHEARIKLVIRKQSETGFLLSHMDVCPSTYTWKNIVRLIRMGRFCPVFLWYCFHV